LDSEADPVIDPCLGLEVEHRASCRAMHFWHQARQGRDMPRLADLGVIEAPEFRHNLFVVAVGNGGGRFLIRRSCALLDGLCHAAAPGRPLADVLGLPLGALVLECCNNAALARRPFLSADVLTLPEDIEIRYRIAFLPLSDGGTKVDHLLGVISFRMNGG
jgi:hypothetical protein